MRRCRYASVWIVVAGLLLGACGNAKAQGITAQQAEEMLKELRAIRQALERVTPPAPVHPLERRRLHGRSAGWAGHGILLVEGEGYQTGRGKMGSRFS